LPQQLAVGAGTALFVSGTCFHPEARIERLSFVIDGAEQPVMAHSMPRLDLLTALHPGVDPFATAGLERDPGSDEDPNLHSYLSGFWGVVRIGPRTEGACEIGLRAHLRGGRREEASLAALPVVDLPAPLPLPASVCTRSGQALVAICMATYQPPMELFRRQIDSIKAQTHANWVCVISDDCSSPRRFAAVEREVRDDPRFVLSRSDRRRGFYLNFERALALAPREAAYVALADQDDSWYPDKLARLLGALGGSQLVYSDARVIDREGRVVSNTYWPTRRNNHRDLLSVLVANSVTGAASLLRRELLDYALPFPPAQFAHFHDHWLALTALSLGDVGFVEQPLYDYVQHGEAALGHAAANQMLALRDRLRSLRRDPRERVRMWRLHYYVDVGRLMQCAAILELRCGARMPAVRRRQLQRFVAADRSLLALANLWRRGLRELVGRPETLGAEWMLSYAFTWRRLLAASARERPIRGLRLDSLPPPDLALEPGKHTPDSPRTRAIAEKIAPLRITVSEHAPPRVNLLVPTIDLAHFFGGYIAKFNLAAGLARRGLRVRIVTVDPVPPLPQRWQQMIEGYAGLKRVFDHVEVTFAREAGELEVSRSDAFIATTWWTAHIAATAVRELGAERFFYLIQEYEPFTFPMGTYAALASESYEFPHTALFSSELLRDYFRRRAIGVFAAGERAGEERSASFQNAITPVAAPNADELASRDTRRLLFYARPEPHAARNMFELGVLALQRAAHEGAFREGWEVHGIGSIDGGERSLVLFPGTRLELVPRVDQASYARLLRAHDVGLALMYTPHPSLVPIEMASAGMITVTNSFENKTQSALNTISTNLLAPRPTVAAVADALCTAVAAAEDYEVRVRGSAVSWSRDWAHTFDDSLLERVGDLLGER
jgi:glycosyltransferase involved in cell wall biosynthesis